ncbi:MAG TPA: 3,4-dihydroxy-2-butanone-4-phosphate synthase, partial [Leptospiraceae bacterium]|nr:3,4-dihydroxy-2-butanone-4-phosphate synthase [Leptospiraceae bacterium]
MNGNIEQAIEDIRHGRMIILVDSEARENEGDLIIAAEYADAQAVNFMAVHGRGLICVPLDEETAVRLELGPMVRRNTDQFRTNFTVSVDAAHG